MRHAVILGSAGVMLLAATATLLAAPSSGTDPIATVKCSDVATQPVPNQAALVYYAAGYRRGRGESVPAGASASTLVQPVGGLSLDAQAVLAACGTSPNALLVNVVATGGIAGGGAGTAAAATTIPAITSSQEPGTSSMPEPDAVSNTGAGLLAPTTPPTPGAASTPPGGADAAASDLNAASQQLNTNLQTSILPVPVTPVQPAPVATPSP
jgi:hypothetical protein